MLAYLVIILILLLSLDDLICVDRLYLYADGMGSNMKVLVDVHTM